MEKRIRKALLENGSVLLQDMISSCNGKCNPIRSFSAMEILRATNNFDPCLVFQQDRYCTLYKGSYVEDLTILIKKYSVVRKDGSCPEAFRDIVIGSQMSSHSNVLKLLGCCLELQPPVSVFEYPENGPLDLQLPWEIRLKIAKEIANAVTYLHIALPRAVIHRSLANNSVFLDKHNVAKLSNFSLSITIPDGQTHVVDDDPDMAELNLLTAESGNGFTTCFTEHIDVFGFGWFMAQLLTGKTIFPPHYMDGGIEERLLDASVDPMILEEDEKMPDRYNRRQQEAAFLKLVMRCTQYKGSDRPSMIDLAKELRRIESLVCMS